MGRVEAIVISTRVFAVLEAIHESTIAVRHRANLIPYIENGSSLFNT